MCCFSPVTAPIGFFARLFAPPARVVVSETKIFARLDGGLQHLVYALSLSTPADVAMVLPLPVAAGFGERALEFVDLSGYADFFSDLDSLFPPILPAQAKGSFALRAAPARPKLVVHTVGAFDASFVPTIRDFDRLDARFRLPDDVWEALPGYADFGFAVFKLRKGRKQHVHPMALRFRTREPDALFFPTVHVHDGRVHDSAEFDHRLYWQSGDGTETRRERPEASGDVSHVSLALTRSHAPARVGLQIEKTRGLVAPDEHVETWSLSGMLANVDTRARLVSARALNGRAASRGAM